MTVRQRRYTVATVLKRCFAVIVNMQHTRVKTLEFQVPTTSGRRNVWYEINASENSSVLCINSEVRSIQNRFRCVLSPVFNLFPDLLRLLLIVLVVLFIFVISMQFADVCLLEGDETEMRMTQKMLY